MLENICALPTYQHFLIILGAQTLAFIALGLLDAKIAKDEKIESNSLREFILNLVFSMVKRLFTKGK